MNFKDDAYERTMASGAEQYRDVIDLLTTLGLPAAFTQTGGMNAAIEVRLDAGRTLLITDAEDALSWDRLAHKGWTVGLYPSDDAYGEGPLAFETTDRSDLQALLGLVERVLARDS